MSGSFGGAGNLFQSRFAGGLAGTPTNGGGRRALFGFWLGGLSSPGTVAPTVVRAGWAPSKPWKPSKRARKEIEELLAELEAKAKQLQPVKRRQVEQSADELRATFALLEAEREANEAQAEAERLLALMRSAVRARSITNIVEWSQQLEIAARAIQEEDEDDDLLLLN